MSDKDRNPVRLAEILAQKNAQNAGTGDRPVLRRAMPMNGPIIPGGHVSPPHPSPTDPAATVEDIETISAADLEPVENNPDVAERLAAETVPEPQEAADASYSRAPQAEDAEPQGRTRRWAGVLLILIAAAALYVIYQRSEIENTAGSTQEPQVSNVEVDTTEAPDSAEPAQTATSNTVVFSNDPPPTAHDLQFDFAPSPVVATPAPLPIRETPTAFGRSAPQSLGVALQVPSRPVLEVTPIPPFSPAVEAAIPTPRETPVSDEPTTDTVALADPSSSFDPSPLTEPVVTADEPTEDSAPEPDLIAEAVAEAIELAAIETENTVTEPIAELIANSPFSSPHRFIIHYNPAAATAAEAQGAAGALRAQGAEQVEVATVPFAISATHIRQYHTGDDALANAAQQALGGAAEIRDFTSYTPRPSEGLIEIWLSPS